MNRPGGGSSRSPPRPAPGSPLCGRPSGKNLRTQAMDHSQQLRQQYLSKAKRVVLKLGSAVLTAADGLNQPLIQRLVGEIGRLSSQAREFILVSPGPIAAGCRRLGFAAAGGDGPGRD